MRVFYLSFVTQEFQSLRCAEDFLLSEVIIKAFSSAADNYNCDSTFSLYKQSYCAKYAFWCSLDCVQHQCFLSIS